MSAVLVEVQSLLERDALCFWHRSIAKLVMILALRYYETNGSVSPSIRLDHSGTYFTLNLSRNLHYEFRILNLIHHLLLFVRRTHAVWH
jgi:hypothetical protein